MNISEQPPWQHEKNKYAYPSLEKDEDTEVVIIGGGITGVVTGYLLTKAGREVILLESDRIGSGSTAYTTAFITQIIDTPLTELVKLFGPDNAKLIWESGKEAIREIETISSKEEIDCEFERCSTYTYAHTERDFEHLENEKETADTLGFETILHKENKLGFENYGYLETPNQAKFHPLKFLFALTKEARTAGVKIFEKSEVFEIRSGKTLEVLTAKAVIKAKHVIVATGKPFNNPKQTHFKKGYYKTYVVQAEIPTGTLKEGLYMDTKNPYHYFRVDSEKDHDRLILGGEDHRAELPMNEKNSFAVLENYLKSLLPKTEYKIISNWSGTILEPSDGLPLIGEYAPGQFLGTAFSGNGMTYSIVSALLFRDMIAGKANKWAALYDPKRKSTLYQLLMKGKDYTAEFFGGAVKNVFRHN